MRQPQRLWAISDIHIDNRENDRLLRALSDQAYQDDMLIIAGDATDNLDKLLDFLAAMQKKFHSVAFVPGNHELWLRQDEFPHSIDKFNAILDACRSLDVITQPVRFGLNDAAVWVVPLFSWYEGPDEAETSLFVPKHGVNDATDELWRDFFLARWPENMRQSITGYFLGINTAHLQTPLDAPVVSFSHFLPRGELMFRKPADGNPKNLNTTDMHPAFNFSRVAGTSRLDEQIRQLGSRVHIYGHQHRNRCRMIDNVTYVSHCLGYPGERDSGHIARVAEHPRLIWQSDSGFAL